MRYETTPMEYKNERLMADWNEYNIMLKVWLFPEEIGPGLPELQKRYPKPTLEQIDRMFGRVMWELASITEPLVKY